MTHASNHNRNTHTALPQLSTAEITRYARHIILPQVGQDGQRKLKAASVLIVGTGGLGSPIALYLAAAGVGRIGLVDFDVVDVTNLQRQIVHGDAMLGVPKVDSATERLRSINPHIKIDRYNTPLTSHNALDILAPYDLVIDGTDNFPTRYLLNDASVMLDKPLVYGSIYRFEGQVSVFDASQGPCYRCLVPQPPPPELVPSCAEAGVLGILPGTIGTLQATEAIKLILGIGEALIGRLLLYDALAMSFDVITLPKRPDCPVCGENPTITELIDYEEFCGMPAYERSDTGAASASQHDTAQVDITVEDAKARLDNDGILLLDIREPEELAICQINGAHHIPFSQIDAYRHEIPRDRQVVVFCHLGVRSRALVTQLRQAGFDNVWNMVGGIDAWSQCIDPSIPRY